MAEDNRKRYACKCPKCEKDFSACKSIFHEMGYLDMGSGRCPKCNEFLNLTVDEDKNRMIVTPMVDFRKNIGVTN